MIHRLITVFFIVGCSTEPKDCAGVEGGIATIDDCGICGGNNENKDCLGECFGNNYGDEYNCSECSVYLWGNCYDIKTTTTLNLSGSRINGEIPPEIGNLKNLFQLWLYDNNLKGTIPPEIGNLTYLMDLNLSDNQLSGGLPEEICNLEFLWFFSISNNQFCPPYPSCINSFEIGVQDTSNCPYSTS
tara:strand:+ start:298 stop:858 length:561 start_codon:yes stop_codon:yes gene_type:complete